MTTGDDIKNGYVVQLIGDDAVDNKFFLVVHKEGSDYETGRTTGTAEFSTVATATKSNYKNIDRIEPDNNQIVWYNWYIRDGCEYQMKLKAGTIRFGPVKEPNVGIINNEKSGPTDPSDKYSFWLFKDWYPSIEANNITPYTLTPKIYFEGYKFDIKPITDQSEIIRIKNSGKFSIINLGGLTA